MHKSWWKIVGVSLVFLGLIAGMLVPLKPGITSITSRSAEAGALLALDVTGYNTRYLQAKELQAYLRLGEQGLLPAQSVEAVSDRQLRARFDIPAHTPKDSELASTTLVVTTDNDGYQVLPDAVFISKGDNNDSKEGKRLWEQAQFENLQQIDAYRFPFRPLLNETIRNTFYHITLWFAMFILLIAAFVYSIKYLRKGNSQDDIIASSFTTIAILYGTMGIITGSFWARFTWGAWWTTDVKLNMSATAMLIYFAYLILRGSIPDRDRRARLSAVYNIFAFVALIPLVFVIPRLTDSLHPGNGGNPALGGEDMDHTMRLIFYPMIIGMTLVGVWMTSLKVRAERLKDHILEG